MKANDTQNLDENLRLLDCIDRANQLVQRAVRMPDEALAPSQRRVLRALRTSRALTQQELREALDLSPASLSEVLAKLERKGLITRTRLESDRRSVSIRLTRSGMDAAGKLRDEERRATERIFRSLDKGEKDQLEQLLVRLIGKEANNS